LGRGGKIRSVALTGGAADADMSADDLFTLLWEGLADILGTAAAAALVRRAARTAVVRCPELVELDVVREDLAYVFTVPAGWHEPGEPVPAGLAELWRELRALLIELTGLVVLRHLARLPGLGSRGLQILPDGESP
jgi:hypothetical protein